MKPTKWLVLAGLTALFASCGENSSKDGYDKDTTSSTTTTTQTNPGYASVDVPASTRTAFETKYPSAKNVQWSRYNNEVTPIEWDLTGWPMFDTSDYYVTFDVDGYDYYAYYDEMGNWIGSTYTLTDHSKLPTAVNTAIRNSYSGYTIVEVDTEFDKNRTAYEVELQKGDEKLKVLFDENGNVLKKKTRAADGTKTKEKVDQK